MAGAGWGGQRPRPVLDLRDCRAAGSSSETWRQRAGDAAITGSSHHRRAYHLADQRNRRVPRAFRSRPRRLSRHRLATYPQRDGIPDRAPAGQPASDHHDPCRSTVAAGALARPQSTDRTAIQRPVFYAGRGGRFSCQGHGTDPFAAPGRGAGIAHRGLDRRPANSGALHAGPRRHLWLHRGVLWQPPAHCGLSGRGGSQPATERHAEFPSANVGAGPSERAVV